MPGSKNLIAALFVVPFLVACNSSTSENIASQSGPQAVLGIKTESGYENVTRYEVPKEHTIGDGTIAFEGPGIESENVGYRLYLDKRSVLDIFGKKTTQTVLHTVGRGDDYHTLSDWGMDVLKVGESLGAGGLGVYQSGRLRQLGTASRMSVEISAVEDNTARFTVNQDGLSSGRGLFSLQTEYSMSGQGRRLSVQAQGSKNAPALATGLVKHPNTQRLTGNSDTGDWAYLATWGNQAITGELLGLALFYRTDSVAGPVEDEFTDGVVFNAQRPIHYEVAAAWSLEPGGITDLDAFKAYLEGELVMLENVEPDPSE